MGNRRFHSLERGLDSDDLRLGVPTRAIRADDPRRLASLTERRAKTGDRFMGIQPARVGEHEKPTGTLRPLQRRLFASNRFGLAKTNPISGNTENRDHRWSIYRDPADQIIGAVADLFGTQLIGTSASFSDDIGDADTSRIELGKTLFWVARRCVYDFPRNPRRR